MTNDQAAGPPVGSVEVITSALSVTAAQALTSGHDTALTDSPLPAVTAFHPKLRRPARSR